jgi:hypothetical protein
MPPKGHGRSLKSAFPVGRARGLPTMSHSVIARHLREPDHD